MSKQKEIEKIIYLVGRQTDALTVIFKFLVSKFNAYHIEIIQLDERRKFPHSRNPIEMSICFYIFEGFDTNSRIDEREILLACLQDMFNKTNVSKLTILLPFIRNDLIIMYSNYLKENGISNVKIINPVDEKEWKNPEENNS